MKTLIAVTNLGRVRILKLRPAGDDPQDKSHLTETANTVMDGVGDPLREVVSDQAGQFGKNAANGFGTGMSSGEEHNMESEIENKALQKVAAEVAKAVEAEGFPSWTLAAPQAILRRLTDALPKSCRNALADSVAADLTKVPVAKLEERFLK